MSEACPVCGNDVDSGRSSCPHCGEAIRRSASPKPARKTYRTVNLKHDMPTVEECRFRLDHELSRARTGGVVALKLIHGYGASGVGGELRYAVREVLEGLEAVGKVAMVVPGESLIDHRRQLIRRVPAMKEDPDLRRSNPGVTVVVLQ